MQDDDQQHEAGTKGARLEEEAAAHAVRASHRGDDALRGPTPVAENEAHLVGGDQNRGDSSNPIVGAALDEVQGEARTPIEEELDFHRDRAHVDSMDIDPQIPTESQGLAGLLGDAVAGLRGAGVAKPQEVSNGDGPASPNANPTITPEAREARATREAPPAHGQQPDEKS